MKGRVLGLCFFFFSDVNLSEAAGTALLKGLKNRSISSISSIGSIGSTRPQGVSFRPLSRSFKFKVLSFKQKQQFY